VNKAAFDSKIMAKAIQLAQKGVYTTHPNPRVGCIITKNQQIIGQGYHQRAGQPHAEINALNSLQDKSQARGATAYVTLEPCSHTGKTPPCANALIDAGLSRVVIAMQDPNPQVAGQGIERLKAAGIDVEVGILEQQARQLNPGFIKRMEQGLPWVRVKLAMSLDGRTAMASGESQWITGPQARADVQRYRARADAILTGIGTVLADNPSLNVRLTAEELGIEGAVRQPLRVILDSQLQTPLDAKLLDLAGKTLIFVSETALSNKDLTEKVSLFEAKGVEILSIKNDATGSLSLKNILQILAKKEINEVHLEAGATLSGALIQQGLADEILIYMAPVFMGSDARGLLELPGLNQMKDKINLNINDIRAVGKDWRLSLVLASL